MPKPTANLSNKHGSSNNSDKQLGQTRAQQEDAQKEARIMKLKNIIETCISALKGHEPSEDWSKVKADLAQIDLKDLSKAEDEMRKLNIRATNKFTNELDMRVRRAKEKEKGEDAKTIKKLEDNLKEMKRYQGKPVYATVIRKEEDEVD